MDDHGDMMGTADPAHDDFGPPPGPLLDPEGRAVTAAALVLAGLLATSLFQYLSFFVLSNGNSSPEAWRQYAVFAGPSGLLALAGAVVGWPVRRAEMSPGLRGLAVAATVVGTVVVVAVLAGIASAAIWNPLD